MEKLREASKREWREESMEEIRDQSVKKLTRQILCQSSGKNFETRPSKESQKKLLEKYSGTFSE